MNVMSDELWNTLVRFHREVAVPEIAGQFAPLREEIAAHRRETNAHFDAIYKRFDRLESAQVASPEERNAQLEEEI